MFKVRKDEPSYAFIPDVPVPEENRWGKGIKTVNEIDALAGKSLNINGDSGIGGNPNRYKQHGFHFTADNCIGCHACEAACSEKNDLPPHLSFRSVGYLEGGTYPAYQRLNISMACNHCDNPVCLKGCPTRAYTKFAEYGAVLQDPDICFGCGYCTWVCPYNAPQLDPIKGQVSKCNMCVDRLEVGLKPACATACLGGALDFGIIESTPENRDQKKISIPGFPMPEITHPNVRFQQTKSLPREMTRTDTMAVKYHRDDRRGDYIPILDKEKGQQDRSWNLNKLLSSHENAHIAFTLSAQSVIGAFMLLIFGPTVGMDGINAIKQGLFMPLIISMSLILSYGMLRLNLHLGKPLRIYRGLNNWRLSPVSREIAGVSLFFAGMIAYGFFSLFDFYVAQWIANIAAAVAVVGAIFGFYYMCKLYRIPARPFWDHWQTGSGFIGTALFLGAVLMSIIAVVGLGLDQVKGLIIQMAMVASVGLFIEGNGLIFHARDLSMRGGEGAASYYAQTTTFGKSYILRNILLVASFAIALAIALLGLTGMLGSIIGTIFVVSGLIMSILGRALFYVLVISTTMPGAFFWRNKGFQEHARETGLAEMPQVGVVPSRH